MNCKLCHSNRITDVISLGKQPLANKYPKEDQFATEKFFDLNVIFCQSCKTVQLDKVISRDEMFVDYYYLSSVNKPLVQHFRDLARQIELLNPNFVVDIGSNDGILLQPLKDLSIRAVGVEPSKNVSKIARDKGLDTITAFFGEAAVDLIKSSYDRADVVVASSVFTHLENPAEFVQNVRNLLTNDGIFIVEVEYIKNILDNIQFERFYFDRIFYYSLTSLVKLFASNGMRVIDAIEIEPHGGSLRIVAVKELSTKKQTSQFKQLLTQEEGLTTELLREFDQRCSLAKTALVDALKQYQKDGKKVAAYGAPARVATITNYAHINKDLIEFIVDDSPLKAGRFSPGQHIPIVPKTYLDNNKVDILVVFAYEYLDDIKKKTANGYKYLIPIPPREVN
jgi:methylation protein EvaC